MNLLGPVESSHSARLWKWGLTISSAICLAVAWQLTANSLNSLLLPTFTETVVALGKMLTSPKIWQALWISNQAMVMGFAASLSLGIPLGLLLGRWRALEPFVDPYLNILLVLPKAALIPILIMAAGLGLFSRVLMVFSFSFVYVVVNTRAGMRLIDGAWIEMARVFGANEFQLWRKVLIRGALPAILTGVRLGLIRSVSGMITVELLLLALGIGRLILDYQGTFQADNLYAVIFVVIGESLVLMQLVKWLERRAGRATGQVVAT